MDKLRVWQKKIDASPDKSAVVNIAFEFADLLARNINKISFGEDFIDTELDWWSATDQTYKEFKLRRVSLSQALNEIMP